MSGPTHPMQSVGAVSPFGPPPGRAAAPFQTLAPNRPQLRVVTHDPLLELQVEIRERSLAKETRRAYRHHQAAWEAWCLDVGVRVCPADATSVASHLTWYALRYNDDHTPVRDADGGLVAAVVVGTVEMRLAAIDKLHEEAGLPRPGQAREVKQLMEGLRRIFGIRPDKPRAPLLLSGLRAILAHLVTPDGTHLRDCALHLLHRHSRASLGQLARLDWSDVSEGLRSWDLCLPPDRPNGSRRTVRIEKTEANRQLIEAFDLLQAVTTGVGPVFPGPRGGPLSRQAISKILARPVPPVPQLGPGDQGATRQLRDVALLTTGWFAALRRSNLVGLNWRDLTFETNGSVRLLLRKSKTDQQGRGLTNVLPALEDDLVCPATALQRWREHVAIKLGEDPCVAIPLGPVFCSLDRYGSIKTPWRRLPSSSVNELIQNLAHQSGLTRQPPGGGNPFGGHSLRRGFITQAFTDNALSVPEVQAITHHKDPKILMSYNAQLGGAQIASIRRMLRADR